MKKFISLVLALLLFSSCSKQEHICRFDGEPDISDDHYIYYCECGETSEHLHNFAEKITKEATCNIEGEAKLICNDCGYETIKVLPKLSENGHILKTEVISEPTCSKRGKLATYCEVCNYRKYSPIFGEGDHSFVALPAVEPTCKTTGLTEGEICEECGFVSVQQTEIPMKEHNYVNRICTVCNEKDYLIFDDGFAKFTDTSLKEIVVPKYTYDGKLIKRLGNLEGFYSLEKVTFESKDMISVWSFRHCRSLREIELPNVTDLGERCFDGCSSLETVVLPSTIKSLGVFCFLSCSNLKNINFPNSLKIIEKNAFDGCASLESIVLPDKLERLESGAFEDCSSLKSAVLPDSLKEFGSSVFAHCASLEEVTLPNYMLIVPNYTFYDCSSLKEITLPKTAHYLGYGVFEDCVSLKKVNFGKDIVAIGAYAFQGCSSLESLTLPSKVDTIGEYAFIDCTSLKTIVFEGTVTDWNNVKIGTDAFKNTAVTKVRCTDGTVTLKK